MESNAGSLRALVTEYLSTPTEESKRSFHEKEFWVDYHQFRRLPFFKRLNKYIRQNQWLGYGNRKTLSKVATILKDYQHIGRMGFES